MHIAPLAQQKLLLLLYVHRAPSLRREWGSLLLRDRWQFRGTNSLSHGRKEKWETLSSPDIARNTEESQISLKGMERKHKTPMRASGRKSHKLPHLQKQQRLLLSRFNYEAMKVIKKHNLFFIIGGVFFPLSMETQSSKGTRCTNFRQNNCKSEYLSKS